MKLRIPQQTKTFVLMALTAFITIRFLPTQTFVTRTASLIDIANQTEQTQVLIGTLQMIVFFTTLPLSAILDIYLIAIAVSLIAPEKTKLLQSLTTDYLHLPTMAKTFNHLLMGAIIANVCPYVIKAISAQRGLQNPALTDFALQSTTIITFALIISIIAYYALYRPYATVKIMLKLYLGTRKI